MRLANRKFQRRFKGVAALAASEKRDVAECSPAELDRYWNALLQGGGKPVACGWLNDRFGLRWQIVPAAMEEMMGSKDAARAKRVTDAMLQMVKLDIATLEKAYRG